MLIKINTDELVACMEVAKTEGRQEDLERMHRLFVEANILNRKWINQVRCHARS